MALGPFPSPPLVLPDLAADMRIIGVVTEAAPVARFSNRIGEPAEPPLISPAGGTPAWKNRPSRPYPTGTP